MKKLKDRLRLSRKSAGYSQAILGKQVGFSQGSLIDWEKGRVEPKPSLLEKWAQITQCDPAWLLTGQGNMRETDSNESSGMGTSVGEDMFDLNGLVNEIADRGTSEEILEMDQAVGKMDQAVGKIVRIHRGLRPKLSKIPKKV